jgi:fructokinase
VIETRDPVLSVLGIGELLWDLLPGGERLGGAPFNVVAHLRRLGWRSAYVSAVGSDALGSRAIEEARRLGVDTSLIEINELPTGIVRVELDADGVPDYDIVSPAAYETIASRDRRIATVGGPVDVIVYGTLAQRCPGVHAATQQLGAEAPDAVRLYDVNLRRRCWDAGLVDDLLTLASVVKLNRQEQEVLARELSLPADSAEAFARAASERYGLRAVCVTRGPGGASLLLDGAYAEAPAPPVQVVDTVGAGDAFAAMLGWGLLEGWPLSRILGAANRIGALVASRAGAIPHWDTSELSRPPASPARSGKSRGDVGNRCSDPCRGPQS